MLCSWGSQYAQAIAEYKVALQLVPDNAQVLFNLGGTYIDSRDPKVFPEAEASLKRSLAINPSYPAYANLGALYDREGKYQEAAGQTRKALDLNSQNYVIALHALCGLLVSCSGFRCELLLESGSQGVGAPSIVEVFRSPDCSGLF